MPRAPAPSRTWASWFMEPQMNLNVPSGTGAATGKRLLQTSIDAGRILYLESSVTDSQQESKEMPKHLKIGKHVTPTLHLDSHDGRGFQSPVMSTNLVLGALWKCYHIDLTCYNRAHHILLKPFFSHSDPPPPPPPHLLSVQFSGKFWLIHLPCSPFWQRSYGQTES